MLVLIALLAMAGEIVEKSASAAMNKNCNLLFPTAGCKPNTHFLEYLKDVAKRAKARPGQFLAAQVPRDVCYVASVERR
jgi:hypothetical protein